jgi:hypothetical protein
VTRELDVDAGELRARDRARVVREQHDRQRRIAIRDRLRDVLAVAGRHRARRRIVDAGEREPGHRDVRVAQIPHAERCEVRDPRVGVPVVLVVAGDREHAVLRAQATERLDVAGEVANAAVDKIAGQHDQIGLERVDAIDDLRCERAAERWPDVDIGELDDREARRGHRQIHERHSHAFDMRAAPHANEAVRDHRDRRRDAGDCGGARADRGDGDDEVGDRGGEQQVHGEPEPQVRERHPRPRHLALQPPHHDRCHRQARRQDDERDRGDRGPRRRPVWRVDEAQPHVVVRGAEH